MAIGKKEKKKGFWKKYWILISTGCQALLAYWHAWSKGSWKVYIKIVVVTDFPCCYPLDCLYFQSDFWFRKPRGTYFPTKFVIIDYWLRPSWCLVTLSCIARILNNKIVKILSKQYFFFFFFWEKWCGSTPSERKSVKNKNKTILHWYATKAIL